jgi:hypothetical protein
MARIRTIKPEFWTDTKIVKLPFEARLFFIGLWNFCDDEGFLELEPLRLKMQIFANDNVKIAELITLLEQSNLIKTFSNNEKDYIYIYNFLNHQRICHPSESKIKPIFEKTLESSRVLKSSLEPSALKGKERKGKERKGKDIYTCPPQAGDAHDISYFYKKVKDWYNNLLPELTKCLSVKDARKKAIKARHTELKDRMGWIAYFQWIRYSDFLMGQAECSKDRDKPFMADFDWLLRPKYFNKILEGGYHSKDGIVVHEINVKNYYQYLDVIKNVLAKEEEEEKTNEM